jgi:hypothetical protein
MLRFFGIKKKVSIPDAATDQASERRQPPRILVLGSSPHTRLVTAYAWDRLPDHLNVADYDVVILNLVPLMDKALRSSIAVAKLPRWQQFARLIFSKGSEVLAIGVPGITLGSNPIMPAEWWVPILPQFIWEAGTEIRGVDPAFEFYFQHVRRYHFHATSKANKTFGGQINEYACVVDPSANAIIVRGVAPLARTRFDHAVGFVITFESLHVEKQDRLPWHPDNPEIKRLGQSGLVIWLPPTTDISAYDAVDLILRERYGVRFERVPPAWISAYPLPSQGPLRDMIAQKEREIETLQSEVEATREQLRQASRFQKLLYEQGEDVLEPIARDALRELGAEVIDPKQRGREDGRLIDPLGRNGMLACLR